MPPRKEIESMFDKIASRYDLLNNVLSVGTHWLWKKELVRKIKSKKPESFLDVATGTGDIISRFQSENIKLLGVDISSGMLNEARRKFPKLDFKIDDITNSNLSDKSFDVSAISYGIRNTESTEAALKELGRVTKKTIYILEFGQPENGIFRWLYFGAMKLFIPLIGSLLSKKSSYQYLIDSSISYPSGSKFKEIVKKTIPESKVEVKPLFGGITYLYQIDL